MIKIIKKIKKMSLINKKFKKILKIIIKRIKVPNQLQDHLLINHEIKKIKILIKNIIKKIKKNIINLVQDQNQKKKKKNIKQ